MARASRDGATAPFLDTIYLKAAVLDPSFAMMWLGHDVLVDDEVKEQVVEMVKTSQVLNGMEWNRTLGGRWPEGAVCGYRFSAFLGRNAQG
ncbi:hypothetical protein AAFF_G00419090 [Aldrovandia affinis]|uniref:Uncharacterized protein n=1 Tax=Aldrovandia affinis TaxID=143900 RepID=A0AAD7WJ07_9TELE|nr:hypothetical protein AAFF_G00419090 [Aldrovandia affinis]